MKLSIVIPIYNEENTVQEIIRRVDDVGLPKGVEKEIIAVNDGSTDKTSDLLKQMPSNPELKIFHQEINQGKTAAVKRGIREASGDFVIVQDADLEYDPAHYPELLKPVLENQATVVYGSRFMGKIENMTWVNRAANRISNLTINFLYGSHLSDFQSCYKLIKKDLLDQIKIVSNNFTFDSEITAKLLKMKIKIIEVPIRYIARKSDEGKKITWASALENYFFMLSFRFKSSDD